MVFLYVGTSLLLSSLLPNGGTTLGMLLMLGAAVVLWLLMRKPERRDALKEQASKLKSKVKEGIQRQCKCKPEEPKDEEPKDEEA